MAYVVLHLQSRGRALPREVSSFYYERRLPNGRRTPLTAMRIFSICSTQSMGSGLKRSIPRSNDSLSIMEAFQRISQSRRRIYDCIAGLVLQRKPVSARLLTSLTLRSGASPGVYSSKVYLLGRQRRGQPTLLALRRQLAPIRPSYVVYFYHCSHL